MLVLGCIAGIASFPMLVRRGASRAAEQRGWQISIDRVRPGWQGIWLLGIEAQHSPPARIRARLNAALIPWGSVLASKRVLVRGGTFQANGSLKQLRAAIEGSKRPTQEHLSSTTSGRVVDLSGISIHWNSGKSTDGSRLELWGCKGQLSRGNANLTVDRVDLWTRNTSITGVALAGSWAAGRKDSGSVKMTLGRLDLGLNLGAPRAPEADARPSSAGKPVAEADGAKPTLRRSASERFEAIVERVSALTRAIAAVRKNQRMFVERLDPGTTMQVDQVRIHLRHGSQQLALGPWLASAQRNPNALNLELTDRRSQRKEHLKVTARLAADESPAQVHIDAGPLTFEQLGIREGDFGISDVKRANAHVMADIEIRNQGSVLNWKSDGHIGQMALRQPWLSTRDVSDIELDWNGSGSLDFPSSKLQVNELRVGSGPVHAALHGWLERSDRATSIDVSLAVPLAACHDLVTALPPGFAPLLSGLELEGTFSLDAGVHFDERNFDQTKVTWRVNNRCRVKHVPTQIAPEHFRVPFMLDVEDEDGNPMRSSFGPGTWTWVPYDQISPYITAALLVCEDGRFRHHDGFDSEAIKSSIRDNLRSGQFSRGASTISMQLAKNLYLRKDKTLSRKIQEAGLTMLLEQSFSKDEILELYLNVIEFGPGIYGIGPAAKFYFGASPDQLTVAQSFYLISILPNPKHHHFAPDGQVGPGWMKLLRRLVGIAHDRHYLIDSEYQQALLETPIFGESGNGTGADSVDSSRSESRVHADGIEPQHRPSDSPAAGLQRLDDEPQ